MKPLALLLLALVAAGCSSNAAAPAVPAPPPNEAWLTSDQVRDSQIHTEVIQPRPLSDVVMLAGRVAFNDLRVTHVLSPVSGRVAHVFGQPGQRVKKGAPLVTLISPDAGNAISDQVKAQADLEAAQHEHLRQQELFAAHAGTRRDLETAEDNFRKAEAELERSRQKARLLSGSLNRVTQEFTLRSPIDGEIVARNVNLGMDVQGQYAGGNAAELFTVGELDQIWVLAEVHEVDLPRVRAGAEVEVSVVAYPDESFQGKIGWVSDVLDPNTRTARIRCTLLNSDRRLKPEMFATLRVTAPPVTRLAIPRSSVLRLGEKTFVFVALGEGPNGLTRFVRRPITLDGEDMADWVPVESGIGAGDVIVTQGAILLSEMV